VVESWCAWVGEVGDGCHSLDGRGYLDGDDYIKGTS
jgi:hypothetical protein